MPRIEVIPAELIATAAPLRAIADGLRELADSRWPVQRLVDSSPSAELRQALDDLLGAWTPIALDLSDTAIELAEALARAGAYYRDLEDAVARGTTIQRRSP